MPLSTPQPEFHAPGCNWMTHQGAWPCNCTAPPDTPDEVLPADPKPDSPLDANRRYNALLEAMHDFKSAVLEYYGHEVVAAQAALQAAGIISPSIVTGIKDLTMLYKTNRDAIVDEMKEELDDEKLRPNPWDGHQHYLAGMQFMIEFVESGQ